MKRKLYELINIRSYIIFPLLICSIYLFVNRESQYSISKLENYQIYGFEFVLTILGILLTLLGLMFSLPNNQYRHLMKKYKHDEIIFNTIFIGIAASIGFIILFFFDAFYKFQELLFIVIILELAISSYRVYKTLKFISQSLN